MLTAVIFLPSAGLALFAECRFLALGKEIFADKICAERPLPSAALGKAFAECPQHSAKRASAVVNEIQGRIHTFCRIVCSKLMIVHMVSLQLKNMSAI